MKAKKLLLLVMVVVIVASMFVGCKKEEEPTIAEGTEIHFWHAMGGGLGETLEEVCAMFNEENEYGITVVPTYQGGYGDTHAKVMAALQAAMHQHGSSICTTSYLYSI